MEYGVWGLGFPKIMCTFFGSPSKKDLNISGSILGSPCFGKLPFGLGVKGFRNVMCASVV